MKVQFTRGTFAPGGVQRMPGDVAELPETMAKDMIRMKKAVAAPEDAELTPERTAKPAAAPKAKAPKAPKE